MMYLKQLLEPPDSLTPKSGRIDYARQSIKLPLAFAFGAVLGLSTPGFDQEYLAWLGLAPLLVLVRGCRGGMQAIWTGLVFGLGYYAIAFSFFHGLMPLDWTGIPSLLSYQVVFLSWLFSCLHFSLLFALFALVVHVLPARPGFFGHFRRPYYPYLLVVPFLWVFINWVLAPSPLFMGIPLCQLAYTQSRNLPLIQLASTGGSAAIDFLLILSNCAVANLFIELTRLTRTFGQRTDQFNTRIGAALDVILTFVAISVVVSWGQHRLNYLSETVRPEKAVKLAPQSPPVPIAIVQGNVSIEEESFKSLSTKEYTERFTELASGLGAMLVVLPEGVVSVEQSALEDNLRDIEKRERKELVYGALEERPDGFINCARLLTPFDSDANRVTGKIYAKQKLIPFGEFLTLPIKLVAGAVPPALRLTLPDSREAAGPKSGKLLESGYGKVGVAIANEVCYPKLVAGEVRKGASLLICLANLACFHKSSLGKQYLACATMRAVENRRFMVLSTSTGTSCVIDPAGMVTSRSYSQKRGVLLDTVQFINSRTPYNRMRWL